MVKDKLGNELAEGDLVDVVVRDHAANTAMHLLATVGPITSGGISMIGGTKHGQQKGLVTPGVVSLHIRYDIQFPPDTPQVIEITKVVNPAPPPQAETPAN